MRLAIFTETFVPRVNGIVTTLRYLLEHLARRGHESILFAPNDDAPTRYANTEVISLPGTPFPFYPEVSVVSPIIDVSERLQDFRPDLIHVLNPFFLGVAGIRHAHQMGVPLVASYHTDIAGFAERWGYTFMAEPSWSYMRWLHNQADLNLCPSQATLGDIRARGFQRLKVWSRGVDTERFHPRYRQAEWRRRLTNDNPDALLLLSVGRLSEEKRIRWLHPVLEALPDARLAIVGDGPARSDIEMHFAGTPTVFTGYLRGDDLAAAYAAADVFVFPAANETFGNVVLEAMASGLPVVAAASGGPLDVVVAGETGLLFDPEDPADLVHQVCRLADSPARIQQMGIAARHHAEARDWTTVLDGLLEDYESIARPASPIYAPWLLPLRDRIKETVIETAP